MTRPWNRGFSLLEILMSLFVIVAMLAIAQAMIRGISLTRHSSEQDLALKIAKNELEGLRSGGYGALPSTGSFSDTLLANLPQGKGTVTVTAFNAKTKKAAVLVSWQEPGLSASSTVSLTTLLTETGGLQ